MSTKFNSIVIPKAKMVGQRLFLPWLNELKRISTIMVNFQHVIQLTSFGDVKFLCSTRMDYAKALNYGWEMLPLSSFLFLLKQDDTVWDVGASVGLFAIHAAQRVKGVVAFEPDPEAAARLHKNIHLNGLQNKVDIRQLALGNEAHQEHLYTDGLGGFAPAIGNLERHSAAISIEMTTVDKLIQEGTETPSVMKIDIEGAEFLALQGAADLLRSQKRPRIIFIEVHPAFLPKYGGSSEEVFSFIDKSGYAILSTEDRAEQQHLIALAV